MNRFHMPADMGGTPLLINLHTAAQRNTFFRNTLWTGEGLQLTVMSIPQGGEIGVEMHRTLDQMLRVEEGVALVQIGKSEDRLHDERRVGEGCAILVPRGTYHNVRNLGRTPLKLSSVYGPPAHAKGTVHRTAEDAAREHESH